MQHTHKQRIRSLIVTIPHLMKASLVSQAFEAERVIASTFEFSDTFREYIRNVPPHYIEQTKKSYSELMFKAFEGGYAVAKSNSNLLNDKDGEELLEVVKIKFVMPGSLSQDLMSAFVSKVGDLYQTVVNNAEMYVQFKKDLEIAFAEGVVQFAGSMPKERAADKIEKVEDAVKDAQSVPVPPPQVNGDPIIVPATEIAAASKKEEGKGKDKVFVVKKEDLSKYLVGHSGKKYEITNLDDKTFEFKAVASTSVDAKSLSKAISNALEEGLHGKIYKDYSGRGMFGEVCFGISVDDVGSWEEILGDQFGSSDQLGRGHILYWPGLKYETMKPFLDKIDGIKIMAAKEEIPEDGATPEEVSTLVVDSLTQKMEEYTKLLNDPVAENVLRYTLGLPPRSATASIAATDIALAKLIGPYDTDALTAKTLSLAKSHDMSNDDLQSLIVDCIVADVDSYESEADLSKVIALKLCMNNLAILESLTMDDVDTAADVMAEALTSSVGLHGDFFFMENDGDYCLIFVYTREEAAKLASAGESLVFAAIGELPGSSQGALTVSDQEEIRSLCAIGKLSSLKKVKLASPKVAALMSEALTQIRNSKVDIVEGCKMLKQTMSEYIGQAFGQDGVAFYDYVKKTVLDISRASVTATTKGAWEKDAGVSNFTDHPDLEGHVSKKGGNWEWSIRYFGKYDGTKNGKAPSENDAKKVVEEAAKKAEDERKHAKWMKNFQRR